jgi:hypothetical protein
MIKMEIKPFKKNLLLKILPDKNCFKKLEQLKGNFNNKECIDR